MVEKFLKKKKDSSQNMQNTVPEAKTKKPGGPGAFEGSILEIQKRVGNRATAELLRLHANDGKNEEENSSYYANPLYSLSQAIESKYFNKGSNLMQYIPDLAQITSGDIPKQFMNLSFDTGGLVAGIIRGNGKAVVTAFLKNTARQTTTMMDNRRVRASGADSVSDSRGAVLTNGVADSAVSIILNAAAGAKNTVRIIQDCIDNSEEKPTGIETIDKVLPFMRTKKDERRLESLNAELERLKSQGGREAEMKINAVNKEIETVKLIIKRKIRKKKQFTQMLGRAWKNIKKSEEDIMQVKSSIPEIVDQELKKPGQEQPENENMAELEKEEEAGSGIEENKTEQK